MHQPYLVLGFILIGLTVMVKFRRKAELNCEGLIAKLHPNRLRFIVNLLDDSSILRNRRRTWVVAGGYVGLKERWENRRILQQILQLRSTKSEIPRADLLFVSGINISVTVLTATALLVYPIPYLCDRMTLRAVRMYGKMAYRVHTLIQEDTPLCGRKLAARL